MPTRLGASRNYVSEPISAFNCTQHTGPGIWETLLIVPDLVSLLTLPTVRILEELPRLGAYRNYVSEPIPSIAYRDRGLFSLYLIWWNVLTLPHEKVLAGLPSIYRPQLCQHIQLQPLLAAYQAPPCEGPCRLRQ